MKEPPIVANQPLPEVLIAKNRSKHHPCTSIMGQYTLDTIPKMIHGTGIFTYIYHKKNHLNVGKLILHMISCRI